MAADNARTDNDGRPGGQRRPDHRNFHPVVRAPIFFEPGETTNFSASDHVLAVDSHAGGKLLDSVVVSTSRISPALRRRYAEQNAAPIENDIPALERMGLEVIGADLVQKGQKVRHDPAAIARVAVELAVEARKRR